jgi:hypothetical protein
MEKVQTPRNYECYASTIVRSQNPSGPVDDDDDDDSPIVCPAGCTPLMRTHRLIHGTAVGSLQEKQDVSFPSVTLFCNCCLYRCIVHTRAHNPAYSELIMNEMETTPFYVSRDLTNLAAYLSISFPQRVRQNCSLRQGNVFWMGRRQAF